MEDILIAILSLLGDFILELFAWLPWDWLSYGDWPFGAERSSDPQPRWAVVVVNIGLGAALGWLSIFVFPSVLIHWGWLRIALLFASPVCSGLIAYRLAQHRRRNDESIDPAIHFYIGLCFSIGFVWTRFVLAQR